VSIFVIQQPFDPNKTEKRRALDEIRKAFVFNLRAKLSIHESWGILGAKR
jgi:hypothetical protein